MKDRLEYPLEFLESMRTTNFEGNEASQIKSRALVDALTDAIKSHSTQAIQEWIEKIDFNPESLGSAFLTVHRFAIDFLAKSNSIAKPAIS